MSRNGFVSVVAMVAALSSVTMAQTSQPKPISYESLCKLDQSGPRRVAWMSTTAESRAETTKTQVARFRDVYRGGLTSAQYAHIAELLAAITPEVYTNGPTGDQARLKAQKLSHVTAELFTPAQMRQMSVVDGNCIEALK
jgi:hypothetical protein